MPINSALAGNSEQRTIFDRSKPMEAITANLSDRSLSRNLSEQVSQRIGEKILSGGYAPNEILPDEPSLTEIFGVSRTVIREAIKMLVSKGMLEVRPRTGTRVTTPGNWQLLDRDVLQWHQSIKLDNNRLAQLMELRQSIEPDAAMYAATRRTDQDVAAIRRALEMMAASVDKNSEYVIADAHFHSSVLRAAHNQYIDALESAVFAGLLLSIRVTNPNAKQNSTSIPLHTDIAEAIIAQDPNAAYAAMKLHLADASRRLSAILSKHGQ
jgi:GntR family transcriptional regulator, galactonate operon transcriptional repressor